MCHLSVYSGAARTHKSRWGGRCARVDAIGPGDPGVRVAQRWVLVGSVRGPRELRAHRGGAAAGELFRQNRTQQWRRSHRGRSGRGAHRRRAARVAHVCLHMGVGVMLRADRVAKITRSHSVSSFPTSQSLIALPN